MCARVDEMIQGIKTQTFNNEKGMLDAIILQDSNDIEYIRSLGRGKAAVVELIKNKDGELTAEKRFVQCNIFTRGLYKLAYQAPLPYRTNINAVAAAYYTRAVIRDLTAFWFGSPKVAEAKYIRWDRLDCCWVLGTEFISGRGPDPNLRFSTYEIFELTAFMDKLMEHLFDAGLYGPMWQADKSLSVPTSNYLLNHKNEWIWIDLESGMPGIQFFKNKPYITEAKKKGFSPLFGDIDFDKLWKYIERYQDILAKYPSLKANITKLQYCMHAWKESELALFRDRTKTSSANSDERDHKINITEQYICTWKKEYNISTRTEMRIRNSMVQLLLFLIFADLIYLVINDRYRKRWLENKFRNMEQMGRIPIGYRNNVVTNIILSKLAFKELHFWIIHQRTRAKYKEFGIFYINEKTREFDSLGRLTTREKETLRDGTRDSSAYIRGFGYHLFLKPFSIYFNTISIFGVLVTQSWVPLLFMLVMPSLRVLATIILWVQERLKGNKMKIGTALIVGAIPKIGIMAFPFQMYHRQREIFWLLLNSILSGFGRRIPLFGEINSTLEHWFIRRNPVKTRDQKAAPGHTSV